MMTPWTRMLLPLIPAACCFFASRGLLHFFQLESYQFPGYFRSLRRNRMRSWLPGLCATVACVVLYYLFDVLALRGASDGVQTAVVLGAVLAACGVGAAISASFRNGKAKKALVFTGRVKRLCVVYALVCYGVSYALSRTIFTLLSMLMPLWLPLWLALAGLLAWPVEKLISECYFRDARRKLLSMPGLTRIGITGSYGKTSVKHILGVLLSEKYPTLITPASYNTPMGVSKAIREKLTPSDQVFVGEMGARHVGDIKEMCRLVRPIIGVITSIGPQHLETFHTQERINRTKYELIEALPEDGQCFFPDDGGICLEMYQRTRKPKTLVSIHSQQADVWCGDIRVSPEGSHFTLHLGDLPPQPCHTLLLGEHNIQNILLCAAVAWRMGLTPRQIAHGIEKLQPIKARLELITHPGSFTIINDAFNSNPAGAKAALAVFSQFPRRRIIITPGMVELGAQEAEFNRAFGRQMAAAVDVAVIVGKKRALPIIEGLTEAGFPNEQIVQVASLDASTAWLREHATDKDTVLYENDLPDHYQDA